jgi:hypothetical protein
MASCGRWEQPSKPVLLVDESKLWVANKRPAYPSLGLGVVSPVASAEVQALPCAITIPTSKVADSMLPIEAYNVITV